MLTCIPLVTLGIYLAYATQLFEKDKIAYVYDASVTLSRTMAAQVHSELRSLTDSILPMVAQYDPTVNKLTDQAKDLFSKQEKIALVSFFRRNERGTYDLGEVLKKDSEFDEFLSQNNELVKLLVARAKASGIAIKSLSKDSPYLLIAVSGEPKNQNTLPTPNASTFEKEVSATEGDELSLAKKNSIVFFIGVSQQIQDVFSGSSTFTSYLVGEDNTIEFRPSEDSITPRGQLKLSFFEDQSGSDIPEGTQEYGKGESALLASYSKVGVAGLKVISLVKKSTALSAGRELLIKSIYFFVMLFSATFIISIFASRGMTATLSNLYEASRAVARGQFNIQVPVTSNDEVGGLSQSFNQMAKEVSRLLDESGEKARMQNELKTAKTVQETLFPPRSATFGSVEINGFYEPASECGGDWWHYCEIGDYVFLWIGDATGHGAAAALITSAARSAASIIENLSEITPLQALQLINTAIHGTSKGKMMMTFFLAAINKFTGEMSYSNASHEFPYVLRNKRPLDKSDVEMLDKSNGPRLGYAVDSKYDQATLQLNQGDIVLFYTDGIPDLKDQTGKSWGERRYINAVLDSIGGDTLESFSEKIQGKIQAYRKDSPLVDDLTYFAIKFKDAA